MFDVVGRLSNSAASILCVHPDLFEHSVSMQRAMVDTS
jgi:hypothetical protein